MNPQYVATFSTRLTSPRYLFNETAVPFRYFVGKLYRDWLLSSAQCVQVSLPAFDG